MKKNSLLLLFIVSFLLSATAQYKEDKTFCQDYIKATMVKAVDWQLEHPKHAQNDWTNGAFYAGVFAAWETTQSPDIFNAMMAMGKDSCGWRPYKRWYHADDVAICQTYIDLYRIAKKQEMIQPTIDTLAVFMAKPYPTRGVEVIKWWWCDALFMGPPTMVKMGVTTKDMEYLKKNDTYFKECYELLYNKEEHLFARDLNYVIKNDGKDRFEANGKRIFWSRGNGWVMGGLVRVLKELPVDYVERPFYEQLFKEMSARILSLQQTDGLWRASLLDPASYPGGEVSGSGFFCYALTWGINNGLLDPKTYRPAVEKAWKALSSCVNEEGRVGWVQPIGADPRKNFSGDSWEVYGTGAYLLAGSEIIKMQNSGSKAAKMGWKLGAQAYTFKEYSLEEALQKSQSIGLKNVEFYSGQTLGKSIPGKMDFLNINKGTMVQIKGLLKQYGITPTAMGVFTPKGEADWTKTFEFAKAMNIGIINSEPDPEDIPMIDRLATKYKIKVAIHNHPQPSRYWNPQTVLDVIKPCGKYIGACADLGHWVRSGLDPIECLKQLNGHIFSLHCKDLNVKSAKAHDVPWGTGVCNIEEVMKELKRQQFKGTISIEYEYNWNSSVPEIRQSVNYFNQVVNYDL